MFFKLLTVTKTFTYRMLKLVCFFSAVPLLFFLSGITPFLSDKYLVFLELYDL